MIYSFLEFEFALVKTILARCNESARRVGGKESRLSGAFAQKCSAQKSMSKYFTEDGNISRLRIRLGREAPLNIMNTISIIQPPSMCNTYGCGCDVHG
jgi:hypothetical protein